MKPSNKFVYDLLDFDSPEAAEDVFWLAGKPTQVWEHNGAVIIEIPFQAQTRPKQMADRTIEPKLYQLVVRAYGSQVVRCSIAYGGRMPDDRENPMIEWDPTLAQKTLRVNKTAPGWELIDGDGAMRMRITTQARPIKKWSSLLPPPQDFFEAAVFPDGRTEVPFMAYDTFSPGHIDSASMGYVERNMNAHRSVFSLHARADEKFAGTGERFLGMNLAGTTLTLENEDASGANSRRAYKNIPFYVSSRGYGLLIMTSNHVRLSLADISTRAVQGLVESDVLDLFFIGGNNIAEIVQNYQRITGFPRKVPLWSYGVWMSRMTYFSADETLDVVRKLREGQFPCDVIHLDTGWFRKDWQCDWQFNEERFPDPKGYMDQMRELGIRISLWQTPNVARKTELYATARDNGYLPRKRIASGDASSFGNVEYGGRIDYTNPEAVRWYQGLLKNLFDLGAEVIKTDFGEKIDHNAIFYNQMSYEQLHNLYALLYQKAAFDITEQAKGKDQALIWARAGWTGCQRYPVHWSGDCAATWDGLAGTIKAGLHIGLSGFAFWSHDVGGFHGLPDFMNNWPEDDLYVRWTQVGVFSSHMRYHGTSPREPYEYPQVADIVREWLKLRYALIPYLYDQGNKAVEKGYPVLRALVFHHPDDPFCWHIDDQFYCGDNLLVAPVLNKEGVRDVYLPEGQWTDLWTGETINGPVLLKGVKSELPRIPVYCVTGSQIPVYPEMVQHTGEMDLNKIKQLNFDQSYKGFEASILGKLINL
ncbi:MAG TPA: alpha-xylosidase [Firmicutes bacterium]|nr:alpha-xylosidase [Bacillota bacterium]